MNRRRRAIGWRLRRFVRGTLFTLGLVLILLAVLQPNLGDFVGPDAPPAGGERLPPVPAGDAPPTRPPSVATPDRIEPGDGLADVRALDREFLATVVAVRDGDTIDVRDHIGRTIRIRLHGIDAPEFGQPAFRESTAFVRASLAGRQVRVVRRDIDPYDRLVGEIWLNDARFNVEIVRQGWAWVFRRFAGNDRELLAAEAEAQSHGRGLWADSTAVPPWNWRRQTDR